ncbi:uncharacterized protein LOC122295120 [Carya illinoinensis]|uniref:RING-type E3 ubiquitin transferase n=1 Tax=Carya illinoinensis TaxID=32201 RepID=A0A8T1NJ27_CARIL|nr:uncharacterized protein LOC122295120 [Carya illinoinensis]KAG6628903.1 hypothetical protein CIPAW_14G044900 [Carya illinoinensis]
MDCFDFYCHSWLLDFAMSRVEEASYVPVNFIFKVEATFTYVPQSMVELDNGDNNNADNIECETFEETFHVLRNLVLQESTSRTAISDMLYVVRVPLEIQEFMVHRISTRARDVMRQTQYMGRRDLEMRVTIRVSQCINEESLRPNYTQISRQAMEYYVLGLSARTVPKSWIEALEKVEIEGISDRQCAICLEELSGPEGTRMMPCLHLFHEDCIRKWLERSLFCPLCRFKLA